MGRPKGAENKDKSWRHAIRAAVNELRAADDSDKPKKVRAIRLLARKLVTRALEGDVAALKELGDESVQPVTATLPKPDDPVAEQS